MMAEPREQLQWERDALAAGMGPAEVETRRDLIEKLNQTAENAIEGIDRERAFTSLVLKGMDPDQASEKVDIEEHPARTRFDEFQLEGRRALEHLYPEEAARVSAHLKAKKQKRGGRKRRGRR